jgi:hypothetical protein
MGNAVKKTISLPPELARGRETFERSYSGCSKTCSKGETQKGILSNSELLES